MPTDLSFLSKLLPIAGAAGEGYLAGKQIHDQREQVKQMLRIREATEMRQSLQAQENARMNSSRTDLINSQIYRNMNPTPRLSDQPVSSEMRAYYASLGMKLPEAATRGDATTASNFFNRGQTNTRLRDANAQRRLAFR